MIWCLFSFSIYFLVRVSFFGFWGSFLIIFKGRVFGVFRKIFVFLLLFSDGGESFFLNVFFLQFVRIGSIITFFVYEFSLYSFLTFEYSRLVIFCVNRGLEFRFFYGFRYLYWYFLTVKGDVIISFYFTRRFSGNSVSFQLRVKSVGSEFQNRVTCLQFGEIRVIADKRGYIYDFRKG